MPRGAKRINISTAQQKTNEARISFSPMAAQTYKGFACFHNYWQSFLRYQNYDSPVQRKRLETWWRAQPLPRKICPLVKNKLLVGATIPARINSSATVDRGSSANAEGSESESDSDSDSGSGSETEMRDVSVLEARRRVYIPEYMALVRNKQMLTQMEQRLASGESIALYDYCGPRGPHRSVAVKEATPDLLRASTLLDESDFGHGYVLAALLCDVCVTSDVVDEQNIQITSINSINSI